MEYLKTFIDVFTNNVGILNNIILAGFFIFFIYIVNKASKDKHNPLNWADMFLDSKTKKMSLTKVGNFWGIGISSWIVIYFAQKIPPDKIADLYSYIFGIWMAFLLGTYSVSNVLKAKDPEAKKDEDEK
mgnify:CR=1 FL=1